MIDSTDDFGRTPALLAASSGNLQCFQVRKITSCNQLFSIYSSYISFHQSLRIYFSQTFFHLKSYFKLLFLLYGVWILKNTLFEEQMLRSILKVKVWFFKTFQHINWYGCLNKIGNKKRAISLLVTIGMILVFVSICLICLIIKCIYITF